MHTNQRKRDTQICRLCVATTTTYFSLISNKNASEMLKALTGIEIHPDDETSTVMCYKCRLNLNLAYTIQQNMLAAQKRLPLHPPVTVKEEIFLEEVPIKQEKESITAKPITPFMCDLCGAYLKTVRILRKHVTTAHEEPKLKCKDCNKLFKSKRAREIHETKEHGGQPKFVCDRCGKKFYAPHHLKRHVQMTHLKLRPFVCEFCQHRLSSQYALNTHRRQHTNEKPYNCEECGEGFKQNVLLKIHLKKRHGIQAKNCCYCSVCGKGFASKCALYSHQRIH